METQAREMTAVTSTNLKKSSSRQGCVYRQYMYMYLICGRM